MVLIALGSLLLEFSCLSGPELQFLSSQPCQTDRGSLEGLCFLTGVLSFQPLISTAYELGMSGHLADARTTPQQRGECGPFLLSPELRPAHEARRGAGHTTPLWTPALKGLLQPRSTTTESLAITRRNVPSQPNITDTAH